MQGPPSRVSPTNNFSVISFFNFDMFPLKKITYSMTIKIRRAFPAISGALNIMIFLGRAYPCSPVPDVGDRRLWLVDLEVSICCPNIYRTRCLFATVHLYISQNTAWLYNHKAAKEMECSHLCWKHGRETGEKYDKSPSTKLTVYIYRTLQLKSRLAVAGENYIQGPRNSITIMMFVNYNFLAFF